MMIDFISTTKHLEGKDTPFLGNLQFVSGNKSGWLTFEAVGCRRIKIQYNEHLNILNVNGSIMYFMQGHNFSYDRKLFVQGIQYLSTILKVGDLWSSQVAAFENGVIMNVPLAPKDYIQHHTTLQAEKLQTYENSIDRGYFRGWRDKDVFLKMYDVKNNFKHKLSRQEKSDIGLQDDAQYLKFEAHYIRPECLNKGRMIFLSDLVCPEWESVFSEDLYLQYKRLVPMKTLIAPTNKKDLSSADIIALTFAEEGLQAGKSIGDIKKLIYSRIDAISEDVLNIYDKRARKAQINGLLKKLQEAPESKYDLCNQLASALEV